jgi:hypothetical protein
MHACPSRIASIIIWDIRRIACLPNPISTDSPPTGLPSPRNRERGDCPVDATSFGSPDTPYIRVTSIGSQIPCYNTPSHASRARKAAERKNRSSDLAADADAGAGVLR